MNRAKCVRCGASSAHAAKTPTQKCFQCDYNPKGNTQPTLPGFEVAKGKDPLIKYAVKERIVN